MRPDTKLALAAGFLLAASLPAFAAVLGVPTPGFLYFHKQGADSAIHNKAVETCAAQAALAVAPYMPQAASGLVADIFYGHVQGGLANVTFVANVENCMVVKGWDVVRLDDAEGKRIAAMDQTAQAAALAPWVGADNPPGTIVRRYQPLQEAIAGGLAIPDFGDRARHSLSVTSDLSNITQTTSRQPYPTDPAKKRAEFKMIEPLGRRAKIPDGATALVVRALCVNGCGSMGFIRLDDADPSQIAQDAAFEFPHAFLNSSLLDETHVFLLPPGHWRIGNINVFGFCMGGPAFDIAPGEAVFAGTFDGRKMYSTPDLDLAAPKQALGDTDIARRLKPVSYTSGEGFACETTFVPVIYTLEYPEMPFAKDYAHGSHAPKIVTGEKP